MKTRYCSLAITNFYYFFESTFGNTCNVIKWYQIEIIVVLYYFLAGTNLWSTAQFYMPQSKTRLTIFPNRLLAHEQKNTTRKTWREKCTLQLQFTPNPNAIVKVCTIAPTFSMIFKDKIWTKSTKCWSKFLHVIHIA